ncbi:PREDICTED: TMV resistance protein N-like [Fragaria vesca subsp. vesca]
MASSASAAEIYLPRDKYDVFLSFRGLDTRQKFTSHLYEALKRKKIDTYMDNRLERGDEIEHALVEAIEQSKISIIVFSENYASSSWCLDELVHILKCRQRYGQIVIPVFYEIDPSHVRKQQGSYASALVAHEERFVNNKEKVLSWRKVLSSVANLSGFDSKNTRPESALVETIVKEVLKRLNCNSSTNSRGLFGIESQIQQIKLLLSIHAQDVPIRNIGIWGMGGIGKTTLANEVFLRLSSEFDSCSFLANVREESEKYGIHHVRNKLLGELLEEESQNIGSLSIGSHLLRRLSRTKVLVVLDDVNDSSQIEALLGDQVVFAWGSRIIITSRDKRPLIDRVDDEHIYPMKGLEIDDALQLFHLKASKDDLSKTDCLDLSVRAVEIAKGIPLFLTVLSSSFGDCKTREDWEDELNRWQNFPNKKIEDRLRPSYNGLQEDEKGIFLDIACFFKGEKRGKSERILQMHGFSARRGIQILINKSLISISMDNHLEMHDLLQEMGRSIVREQCTHNCGKRSRLWNAKDVYQVLKNKMGTTKLEAICSDISTIDQELQLSPKSFKNMHNLRLLRFYAQPNVDTKMHLPEGLDFLPDYLRYLYWESYPAKSLPSEFSPHNLVELHLPNGKVKKLWNNNGQSLGNLKRLNLKGCKHLIEVPDFSQCPNIETLILSGCTGLVQLYVKKFDKVTTLKLSGCSSLKFYPEMPCNVQNLDLSWSKLTEVPDLSRCPNIKKLYLNHCAELVRLPDGYLKHLAKLTTLNMADCLSLKASPEVPSSLQTLDLSRCFQLSEVPDLSQCPNIKKIDLCWCTNLVELPILKDFEKLICLELAGCSGLKAAPELPRNLRQLDLSSCSQMIEVPDLSECANIDEIDFSRCSSLAQLPKSTFKYLDKVSRLQLARCLSLKVCPELPPNIRDLNLSNCCQLTELPDLSGCPNIETLDLCHCTRLVHIPDSYVGNLNKLTTMYLEDCSSLKVFPKIPQNVKNLHAPSCSQLTEFPDISGCPNIERIDLSDCTSLVHVPPFVRNLDFFRSCPLHWEVLSDANRGGSSSGLEKATNGFAQKNMIGQGGYGVVYKGTLADGTLVAVKQILDMEALDSKGDEKFSNEVEIIGKIRHRNLLSLRGCCVTSDDFEGKRRFLVYDLMTNGNLSDHLSSSKRRLSWPQRKSIILDVAKGLAYLHNWIKPAIYHRDINGTNILLDSEMKAKVADFGLAKQSLVGQTHLTTRVAGTYGYLAPEYALYGQLPEERCLQLRHCDS